MQTLNFYALEHNAKYYKEMLGNTKLCAVVKNDAYGHGIVHVARFLDGIVDCFAVGSASEANRIDFVHNDILILLPQNKTETEIAVRKGYILTLDSFETLNTILNVAEELRLKARVHIKVDSGMSRLGFASEDITDLIDCLQRSASICVEGVYSHFYGESIEQCNRQLNVFLPCAEAVESAFGKSIVKHIANSVGVCLSDRYHLDMARVGLGLYGYGNIKLVPVKTFTAKIIALKNVRAGEVVGYGAKYVAGMNMNIAVADVGYAQGIARALVGSYVRINNKLCPIVAVCMAMIMLDVSDIGVQIGDELKLLGEGVDMSNEHVSIYELLCSLK